MSSLSGILSIALSGLQAQQAGMEVTTNNLANLNTSGYARERPDMVEADPFILNGIPYGMGVQLAGISSLRDNLLDLQISQETQQQGRSQAYVDSLNQIQTLFPDDTSGIGQQISAFFQGLNSLSTNPSDTTQRENVLSAAGNLASAFNTAASQLSAMRTQMDQNVEQQVGEINQITSQIADINVKLASLGSTSQGYSSFVDQRSNLIQQLSGMVDLSIISDGPSVTLTTSSGTALVVDGQSNALHTALDPASGTQHVYSAQGDDITAKLSGGQLGGTLEVRDEAIPGIENQLDSLAGGLVTGLNAAQAMGYDLNGDKGGNLFVPNVGTGAALDMKVAITDPALIAASSDGSAGSNGNLANLTAVAKQEVSNGMTPTEAYAHVVFTVGSDVSEGTAELDASNSMLAQLQQQQSSVSGVSLDEEASHLLLYQRAYQAAAQAITAVDQMMQTAIAMGSGT